MAIGGWDNTNNVFALIPSAEGSFRTADANTGFANLYNGPSASGIITSTMTNMTTGFGYVYNSGVPYYLQDGVNDYQQTDYDLTIESGKDKTFTFRFYLDAINIAKGIFGLYVDANNYFIIQQSVSALTSTTNVSKYIFHLNHPAQMDLLN